jgi:uncharacterized C2H2 Zn-finger protein
MESGNRSCSLNQERDKARKAEQVRQREGPESLVQCPEQEAVLPKRKKNEACLD